MMIIYYSYLSVSLSITISGRSAVKRKKELHFSRPGDLHLAVAVVWPGQRAWHIFFHSNFCQRVSKSLRVWITTSVFLKNAQNLRLDLKNIRMFFYIQYVQHVPMNFPMMMITSPSFPPMFPPCPSHPSHLLGHSQDGFQQLRLCRAQPGEPWKIGRKFGWKTWENTTKNHGAIGKNDWISYENILNTSWWVGNLTIWPLTSRKQKRHPQSSIKAWEVALWFTF